MLDVSCDDLRRAAALLSDLDARLPGSVEVGQALRDVDPRLRVAVRGRPGTGRDTLARALQDRLELRPIGPGDTMDVTVYLIVGWPRAADRAALDRLPPDRTVVALGKADTLGSWDDARAVAHACSVDLGRPVYPTMSLLGCAHLTDDEFALLERIRHLDVPMPSMAAHFITGGPAERSVRTSLLRRLDQFGILTALDLLDTAARAGAPLHRTGLESMLRRHSGLAGLHAPIAATLDAVRQRRLQTVAGRLDRLAAAGHARDAVEHVIAALLAGAPR